MIFVIAFISLCTVAYGYVPILDGRIVGGEAVTIEQYPYQVSVRIYDQHICGGSILDSTTILTACHCVEGMDHSQYSIRAGSTTHRQGIKVKVGKVIPNENYNSRLYTNDMAILKLATPLEFNSKIQPVKLQNKREELSSGTKAWVSGWGVTKEGGTGIPASLRAVDVEVLSNAVCSMKYGSGKITNQMLCAQTLYKDSCQGDSGGPLVAKGKLVGVVSWGYGCARPQYPGVYAKVSEMYDWITANM